MNNLTPTFIEYQTYQPNRDVDEQTFTALVGDSEKWVDEYIFPNVVTSESSALDAYKGAICAIVTAEHDNPGGVTKSYTSGKVREEYDGASIPTHENVARKYLSGSGLLCRWL